MATTREVYKTWTEIKAFLGNPKNLELQYHEFQYKYKIFVLEAGVEYFTELWKDTSKVKGINVSQNDTDLADFEDNYKAEANDAISTDVNVENEVNIGGFGSGASLGVDIGQVNVEEGQMLLYTLPDESGEPLKGPVSIDEKSGDRFELAITDEDTHSKLDELKLEAEAIKEAIGEESGLTLLSKLQDIEIRHGRVYDSDDELYRLTVDSKTKIYGDTDISGTVDGPVHIIEDINEVRRLAVDADIHFEDDAIVEMDNITRRIWDGLVFEYSDVFIEQVNDSKEYLLKVDNSYVLHIFWEMSSELGITVELFENPTVSANGTSVTQFNCNRNSSNTIHSVLYEDPTITADGTRIRIDLLAGSNQTSSRGTTDEMILKAGEDYLIRVTSLGNGNDIQYHQIAYEREL